MGGKSEISVENVTKTPKRHSPVEWRFDVYKIGHWPLESPVDRVHRICSYPAGFPSNGAALVAVSLAGPCAFTGSPVDTWQPVTSLAPY